MQPTTIYLIRHGQTDWNLAGKLQGQTDIPLNATGKLQAKKVAHFLKNKQISLKALYSSDLQRAHQTAHEIGQIFSLNVVLASNLREGYFGKLEGLTKQEAVDLFGPYSLEDNAPAVVGAEPREVLIGRIIGYLEYVAQKHQGQEVAVVTHGAALGSLIRHLGHKLEAFPALTNESITTIIWDENQKAFILESVEHAQE